jgi:uncharacterized glyoxalase superfamily protein PhnB
MSNRERTCAEALTPILYVRDFKEATDYYTKKLLFTLRWKWGRPTEFGCVSLGNVEIFFSVKNQGHPGTWLTIFMHDVDEYYERIKQAGADIIAPPQDKPWACREMQVRDPNDHVIRFGQGLPAREPKLQIDRVPIETRIEKRLAALMHDLARHKDMTVGEMLEETLLHTFEKIPGGGVASPHTEHTLSHIQSLKKRHGIDYDVHASYRFVEKPKRSRKKSKNT